MKAVLSYRHLQVEAGPQVTGSLQSGRSDKQGYVTENAAIFRAPLVSSATTYRYTALRLWLPRSLKVANCFHRKQREVLDAYFPTFSPGQPHLFLFLPKGGFNDTQNTIASRLQVRLEGCNPLGTTEGWDHSEKGAPSSSVLLSRLSSRTPSHSLHITGTRTLHGKAGLQLGPCFLDVTP